MIISRHTILSQAQAAARLIERMEQQGFAVEGVSVAPLAQGDGAMLGMTGSF